MRTDPPIDARRELYTADEIARAAGADAADVRALIEAGRVVSFRGLVAPDDAAALVRRLSRGARETTADRAPLSITRPPRRRTGAGLAASGSLHALALLAILAGGSFLLPSPPAPARAEPMPKAHVVFLMLPGPGGGGGGGGALETPLPPPPAVEQAPAPPPRAVPTPRVVRQPPPTYVRSTARLQRPVPPPRIEPRNEEVPRPVPAPVVQAPVVPVAAPAPEALGVMASVSRTPSAGPGIGGGAGTGAGLGSGAGDGGGLGPGAGGGTGGGPFRPGTGIEPPRVIREVRPTYTDEARRRGISGDVTLEVVVSRDGRVSRVRSLRGLGAGLDERAAEAVRQWRFTPASRQGTPVDVVVEVTVEFTLR